MNFTDELRQNYNNKANHNMETQLHREAIQSIINSVVGAACSSCKKVSTTKRQISGYYQQPYWDDKYGSIGNDSRCASPCFYSDEKTLKLIKAVKETSHCSILPNIEPLYEKAEAIMIINEIKKKLTNLGFDNPTVKAIDTKRRGEFTSSFSKNLSCFIIYLDLKW